MSASKSSNVALWHLSPHARWPDLNLDRLPDWHERAACAGDTRPEWVADYGDVPDELAAVCAACPVSAECRRWARPARATGILAGVRVVNGRTLDERRRHRRVAVARPA